jgi:hypothetical protein
MPIRPRVIAKIQAQIAKIEASITNIEFARTRLQALHAAADDSTRFELDRALAKNADLLGIRRRELSHLMESLVRATGASHAIALQTAAPAAYGA